MSLLIRFHDETLDGFDWTRSNELGVIEAPWRTSDVLQLKSLVNQHALPVTFVIPQQYVYLTEFELPEKASRQVLASIEYQIEDQLGQDTELQHYSLGPQDSNKVPIAVVTQALMARYQQLQQTHALRVSQIIPEIFVCPWSDQLGEVSIIESGDALMVRYGLYQGLKCRVDMLKSMLAMLNHEQKITKINYYLADESRFEPIKVDRYEADFKSIEKAQIKLTDATVINLQQRQYQASSPWLKIFQAWKNVAAVLIVLIIASVFSGFTALQTLEAELSQVTLSQRDLLKDYLDDNALQKGHFKKELIKLLQQGDRDGRQVDFLGLLVEFSQARSAFTSIDVIKVGYQKQRLSIDISSKKLNDVEALHAALNALGLATKLERLNIKPDFISGQFVIEGGSNG